MNLDTPHTIAIPQVIENGLSSKIIYKGPFTLKSNGRLIELEGTISYLTNPRPEVCFVGKVLNGSLNSLFSAEYLELTTPTDIKGSFNLTSINPSYSRIGSSTEIKGELQYELKMSKQSQYSEINFSLVNFINNYGLAYSFNNRILAGRVELQYKNYLVVIDKVPDSKKIYENLKEQNGFAITHIGQIKRLDGKEFELEEIERFLEKIVWILSFVAGRRVDINHLYTDLEGYNAICYRIPSISSWKNIVNWYPRNSRDSLEKVLYCLLELMEDDYWEKQLPRILSYYFDGFGSSYIDNKIIIIQAGLETLAWAYLVETKEVLSKNKYNALGSAASKMERLLKELKIDFRGDDIPGIQEMKLNSKSGPQFLSTIRNDIVHPERKKTKLNDEQLYFTWRMGIVYFELALLAIGGYEGEYCNMLLNFDYLAKRVQKVPWSESNTTTEKLV
ncbi:hypothetical protein NCCP2716_30730 [Sporosarcina sp. NCCP-2716]|uniref:hypothetical protein n=1 Tax=Sporosarcina sp. NCCP-2716 TaxID=2943679 RepID=UPI002040DF96|nr:hypothetical protein [Sporosarcina sp. NCCP-2716]GKV70575.1 hypothetical protein NCCP2716_30730 [Sporosarcina sp. NCCP-2716]